MKPEEASSIVSALVDAFPHVQVRSGTVAAYAGALSDLPAAGVTAACARIIATSRFFPSIAEIRDSVFEATYGFPSSEVALQELRANIKSAGQYSGLCRWSHPALEEAASSVGWWSLSNGENPSAVHSQFLKAYEGVKRAAVTQASLRSAKIPLSTAELPFSFTGKALPGGAS